MSFFSKLIFWALLTLMLKDVRALNTDNVDLKIKTEFQVDPQA